MSRQTRSFLILSKISALIISSLILSSCTPIKAHLDETGYVIGQDNYAFAIYTGDGNLLTHPLEHFRQRQRERPDNPFTDVYVISHGWNFTIPEAIANYHSYIEIFDQQMKRHAFGTEFRPFFIFVVWNSVTRPLTDATRAILPYRLDYSLGMVTSTIDKAVFFLPSVWKQSVNASRIALGQDMPERSRDRLVSTLATGSAELDCENASWREDNCYGVREEAMGAATPLSALLYNLSREKDKSAKPLRIHVVGHSYGAKVAALASMEAVRWWNRFDPPHGSPLESVLLINPAMHPREFSYREDLVRTANVERLLRHIPRKGIVYSNYDYPNGLYFDMSQVLLNNHFNQFAEYFLHDFRDIIVGIEVSLATIRLEDPQLAEEDRRRLRAHGRVLGHIYGAVLDLVSMPPTAALNLGMNILTGSVTWIGTKVVNIPLDFVYHLHHNVTFSESSSALLMALRYTFNAGHFFIPIDRLIWPGQPADQLGLFRPTKPALGRTGLNKTGNGRSKWWNVNPVENFVDDTTDVKPDTFCALARTIYNKSSDLPSDAPALKHNLIYSFDASTVFDGGQFSPSGSHGDVGSHDLVNCDPLSTAPGIQKREHSANFIFNFTKVLPLSNDTASKP